jgi:diaminopimelate decarboxylase
MFVDRLCENSDIFAILLSMQATEEGDLVVIHDSGIYAYVMSSIYNNRLRPSEILIDEATLIRRCETIEDIFI